MGTHLLVQSHNVVPEVGAPGGDHDLDVQVLAELDRDLTCLERQLSGGDDDHACRESRNIIIN